MSADRLSGISWTRYPSPHPTNSAKHWRAKTNYSCREKDIMSISASETDLCKCSIKYAIVSRFGCGSWLTAWYVSVILSNRSLLSVTCTTT